VIDTGSSWLNIKACINGVHCHRHSYEKQKRKFWPKYLPHYRKKILKDENNFHGVVYYKDKS
jgi:hypothetical protein